MEIKPQTSAYNVIESIYPGLVQLDKGVMYFSDTTISDKPLEYYSKTPDMNYINNQTGVSLYGKGLTLILFSYKSEGVLWMEYDFGLSMESCVGLYEHNIHICFTSINEDGQNSMTHYDRQAIEREYAIKNIING